jgi:hypothetical protein
MIKRRDVLILGGATVIAGTASAQEPRRMDFENTPVDALPAGVTTALTGSGGPVKWAIVEDASAPAGSKVLAQSSADRTADRFPLAIFAEPSAADVIVTVKFKPVAGEVDRAGGIAVRLADKDNYYVVRANALEDNVRLYKVVAGKRVQFAGASTKVASGAWHQLGLEARGNRLEVFFNGKSLFSASDGSFTAPGRVALWTKADSVTHFDDLSIKAL